MYPAPRCLPATFPHPSLVGKGDDGVVVCHPRASGSLVCAVVRRDDPHAGRPALDGPPGLGGSVPGRAPQIGREGQVDVGWTVCSSCTVHPARAGSTTACYRAKWLGFQRSCKERSIDPLACTFGSVPSILQCLATDLYSLWDCYMIKWCLI